MKPEDEEIIRRYLLQELGEEERQSVEKRLMTDDDFFKHICVAESEIVEEYARGALADGDREKFERSFLTTHEDRQQVSFNLAFKRYISEAADEGLFREEPRSSSFLSSLAAFWRSQKAAAAFALAIVLGLAVLSIWLVVREQQRQSRFDQLQAQAQEIERQLAAEREKTHQSQKDFEAAQARAADLEKRLAELKKEQDHIDQPEPLVSTILPVTLLPGKTRADSKEVKITPDKETIQFMLRLPSIEYRSYSGEIKKGSGAPTNLGVLPARRSKSETQIVFKLSAANFSDGEYMITLYGITAQGKDEKGVKFSFTVTKD